MTQSLTYLFKRSFEFVPVDELNTLPKRVRGLYVLYRAEAEQKMEVVYVGMVRGDKAGTKGRLETHRRTKKDLWTHCSVFEVWDNITKEQVEELEGLFRHIYRRDSMANQLNKQKGYGPLFKLAKQTKATAEHGAA